MMLKFFFAVESQLPRGLGFCHFDAAHLLWLLICSGLGCGICLMYRRASSAGRQRLRLALGGGVLLCELLKEANLVAAGVFGFDYLPLHLCSLAVFFCFFHALRPGETLGEFLYSSCMPGAFFAILFPDWTAYPPVSYHGILGFLVHTLLVSYPLMQVVGGDLRPSVKRLPRCLAILLMLAVPVYAFDRIFEKNYMFLLRPAPGSPLVWFARLLGEPAYVLGYVPMIVLVWCGLYLPFRGGEHPRRIRTAP